MSAWTIPPKDMDHGPHPVPTVTHGNRDQKRGLGVGVGYPVADDKISTSSRHYYYYLYISASLSISYDPPRPSTVAKNGPFLLKSNEIITLRFQLLLSFCCSLYLLFLTQSFCVMSLIFSPGVFRESPSHPLPPPHPPHCPGYLNSRMLSDHHEGLVYPGFLFLLRE